MTKKVLVVEDESELAQLVELHLDDLGCEVTLASDGDRGLRLATSKTFDLIILDLMLPGTDGLEICKQVRRQSIYTPMLILTAKSSELDRVLGLEVGADDYMTKPFSVRELMARVKALFRCVDALAAERTSDAKKVIRAGDLTIELGPRRVTRASEEVQLTAKEFDLLTQFARHPDRVYTRSELLELVWGMSHIGYEHTVNSHINRLRGKLEDDPVKPRYIQTVWGVGYKLVAPPGTEPTAGAK